MKKITLLLILFISTLSFGQSMPLDFEVPEDDNWGAFNGTVATVLTDPTDATNTVLEMAGSGVDFDGAALTLDTFVDLSDDANNTVSMRIWAPDSTTRTHLLKFEGGSSGATELPFTTNMMGWQTVSIDFGAGLGNEYPIIVLFTDSTPGNTATGTYYIDDIVAPNGTMVPVTPVPMGPAPNPTTPSNEVLSIYSDTGGFTNVWTADYAFGGVTPINLGTGAVNEALQFNLAAAGWGQGTNAVTDISSYNFLQFDYWADGNSSEIRFFVIGNNGAVVEYWYEIGGAAPQEAIVNGAWTHVEIPLSFFENNAPNNVGGTGGFSKTDFFQWKLDASSNLQSEFVYIDNVYFSQNAITTTPTGPLTAAPTPTAPAADVISMFSNAYTDVAVDTWNTTWSAATLADIQIQGNDTKEYTNLDFNGIETVGSPIDATTAGMMFFNMDVWTPNATQFRVKLVDFLGNGFGNGDTEAELTFTPAQGQWVTLSMPLADFTAGGMTSFTDINQLIIAAQPAGAATVYVDNVYFSTMAVASNDDVQNTVYTVFPNPTSNLWNFSSVDTIIDAIQVYDMTGKLVVSKTVGNSDTTVDSSTLTSGLYVARIVSGDAIQSMKLVKK